MSRYSLLIFNGAILTGCAVFIYAERTIVLTALLLLLPLLDRNWQMPAITLSKQPIYPVMFLLGLYGLLVAMHPQLVYQSITILFLVALPEEWFFRAYFMLRLELLFGNIVYQRAKANWLANITTSLFFALGHVPTQGWFGLSVFLPSLFFGWIYQKYKNLILVILLHAFSNLVFILYIRDLLK